MGADRTLMVSMMRAAVVVWMLGAGLTSCASFKKEKSGAELRKEGYEALLKTVKPGMYRRQLYAVLPPYKKPLAKPPLEGTVVALQLYWAHQEKHELDEECHLMVHYQLKTGREYPTKRRVEKGMWPSTIDELLSATALGSPTNDRTVPSKENPDDIILSVSKVRLNDELAELMLPEDTLHPTQEHGVKFGRERESRNDFPFRAGPPSPFAPGKPKAVSDRPPLP